MTAFQSQLSPDCAGTNSVSPQPMAALIRANMSETVTEQLEAA